MDEINFEDYRDPFKAFNIHMSIVCDLEQGGKITEEEAMTEVKAIYKQFKFYYKHTLKPKLENMDKKGFYIKIIFFNIVFFIQLLIMNKA